VCVFISLSKRKNIKSIIELERKTITFSKKKDFVAPDGI